MKDKKVTAISITPASSTIKVTKLKTSMKVEYVTKSSGKFENPNDLSVEEFIKLEIPSISDTIRNIEPMPSTKKIKI